MENTVDINNVLGFVNDANAVFSLSYRKAENGQIGQKSRLRLRDAGTNKLGNRKLMNRSGLLKLKDLDTGRSLDLYIDLLREFNGQKINFLK